MALRAYKMKIKAKFQATLFSLVYGIKAILSIKFEISSLLIALTRRFSIKKSLINRLK